MVEFDNVVIQKWDGPRNADGSLIYSTSSVPYSGAYVSGIYGYRDVDKNNTVIQAEKNKSYDMRVYGGSPYVTEDDSSVLPEHIVAYTQNPMCFYVYIDLDQSGTFEESERVGFFDNTSTRQPGGTFTINIPSTAKIGLTRLRVASEFYGVSQSNVTACYALYGESRDFAINIKAGYDCGISQITAPSTPLTAGIQPVKAMLTNYATATITSCTINWTVDGVSQTAYKWTGSLAGGQSVEVTLGSYNFKSKGVSTSYTITATTSKPNGQDDGDVNNDASPTTVVSMPIGPGTYFVGGDPYDFKTLKEITDLINATGVSGNGDFIVKIRPGTYTGPYTMNNFSHGNINFIFENDPDNPGLVVINSDPNPANYVWYINNIPNVTFKDLTFTANDPNNWGGRIFVIRGNANNYTFENNIFNGIINFTQTLYAYSIIDCEGTQMNNQKYSDNTFNNGYMSLVLINSSRNSSNLTISDNTFVAFSGSAIHTEGIANGLITGNVMKATSTPSVSGIFVQNGSQVINNNISGLTGVNTSSAAITVLDDITSSPAIIKDNKITDCTGIIGISAKGIAGGTIDNNTIALYNSNLTSATCGVSVLNASLGSNKVVVSNNAITMENGYGINAVNSPVEILKNRLEVKLASSKVSLKTISTTGSSGLILLNELIGPGSALENNNGNFTVAYNSTITTGSEDVLTISNGSNKIFRNQLVNKGTGNAFTINPKSSALLDGNNYYTLNGSLGTIDETTYINGSQLLPIDKDARNIDPKYKANNNLKITEYLEDLSFYKPLANINWPEGYQALYEENTFDGKFREGVYYIGAYNIFPVVTILAYTEELIECAGSEGQSLYIAGVTSEGAQPQYQWFKDGDPIVGETAYILHLDNFDYTVSGTYTCRASCAGAKTKYTPGIPVYAITTPSIVEQPKEVVNAVVGNDYSFNVKVHYRGLVPPYYKDYFQWYKYDAAKKDSMPLLNGARFAGTTSTELIITNLQPTDLCNPGDFYFVKVVGQCGTVYSDPFIIAETPEIVFRDNPDNLNSCPGSDIVFTANAIPPSGYTLTYKWMKDGVDLTDNAKYNGVNTNKLQVFDVQAGDIGNYVCVATIPDIPVSKNSTAGTLTLKDIPVGSVNGVADISTKRGNDVTMTVNLIKGFQPITISWYYKDELLKTGVWDQYQGDKLLTMLLEAVEENQAGEYKCVLENECAKTDILFNLTVTKWDVTQSVDVISENGYTLYACMPNPANGNTTIRFEMAETNNAVINLVDQTGRSLSTLYSGLANKGMNILNVNTSALKVSSGVYFYTITTNGFTASLPMVIVK
jgi:hypothetical protein